jgi:acetylornithine/succinyldiaminopimelate/putrescine aminotransferase
MGTYDPAPYQIDLAAWPYIATPELPGPKSREQHARASEFMKGLSGQVRLFPVVFEKGFGCTMEDVDGNKYIDFSSGIYVTTLGHCHPKVSEAVAKAANSLMNAHDFTTPIKVKLLEKMIEVLPGDLKGVQLYDSGRRPWRLGFARAARRRASMSSSPASATSTANRGMRSAWRT